ncbi:outer membrane porin GjpA [Mycolicibacterium septicum]|uniref:outer membrane porin GjpA n=1 Tax=Mycolicibacterium septicum TaxID=98668 RepID=UPI002362DCF5|nr:outer membrane porin GjpA [Mycolicibacterium septicum]
MHLVAQPHTAVGAKQEVNRHWLTAGAVLASAAVIAAAPGIAPVPAGVQHDIQAGAVRLTAGWDPFAPLQAAFDTAKASGTILADNFLLAPGVGLQQAIANQLGYAKQLFDDPSSFEAVSQQFAANVMKVATGLTLIGADDATKDAVLKHTLGGLHGMALDMFPSFLAEGVDVDTFSAVMGILASPLSGVLIGSIGPVVSPAVALLNSAVAISNALQAGDSTTALSSLLGVPAGMVDAFLNGANLNLDALAPMINSAGLIKDSVTIDGLNIAFGGLLTTGSTDRSTYEYTDEDGNKVTIPSVGGSIFNSLGLDVKLGAIGISVKGEAVGPIGALQGLSQTVGVLLGSGWDDWDGKGNAPAPKPPLFGLQPLATGDILSDTAESAGVTKLRDMLKTAAVNDIVKKLQGLTPGTEAAADSATAVAATVDGTDTAASTGVAAATELTHATTNKTVAVSVEKPSAPAPAEDATTTPVAEETGATDEKAGAPTESAGDATTAGKTAPKAQTGVKAPKTRAATTTDKTPRSNLVKGVKDAVKNVRNGLGANSTRKSGESTSSSSGSSTGSDSPAKKDAGSKSKHDDKK